MLALLNYLDCPSNWFGTVKNTFFKIRVFLAISGCGKKKRNVRFLVWCVGVAVCGHLLVVSVRLLVVCSCLLVVCGRWLVVCGRLWSGACFSNYRISRSFSDHIFYRTPPGNCWLHAKVAEFQPPDTVKTYFTSVFEAFYTRATSSYSKAFIYLKSLKMICEEINL